MEKVSIELKNPNFLIIGANKGGTTSLFMYLRQHPEVFVPDIKEPMFFNHYLKEGEDGNFRTQRVIKTFESYSNLFRGSHKFSVSGEASTSYLANPYCAENIYEYNPEMKLIAILRNPIERAFSNYLMYVRWKEEKRSFKQALKDEVEGKELPQGKQYISLGRYVESLKTYQNLFGKKQLKIFLYDDLNENPLLVYNQICNYLDISTDFKPDISKRFNTNDEVEIRPLNSFLKRVDRKLPYSKLLPGTIRRKIYSKPTMKLSDKNKLKILYSNEINELSRFLNRDLSHWLKN